MADPDDKPESKRAKRQGSAAMPASGPSCFDNDRSKEDQAVLIKNQIESLKQLQALYQVEHVHLLEHLHSSIANSLPPAPACATQTTLITNSPSSLVEFLILARASTANVSSKQHEVIIASAPNPTSTPSEPACKPAEAPTSAPTQSRPTLLTPEQQLRTMSHHPVSSVLPAPATTITPLIDTSTAASLPSLTTSPPLPPAFSEAMHTLLATNMSGCPPCKTQGQLQQQRDSCSASHSSILALEAVASGISELDLETEGAIACLASRTRRYLMLRTHTSIGRGSEEQGSVDVNLADELDGSCKLSRKQADIALGPGGIFQLNNMGRSTVVVDGLQVPQGSVAELPHLAMIEAGGTQLLFFVNQLAVDRIMRRSARLIC